MKRLNVWLPWPIPFFALALLTLNACGDSSSDDPAASIESFAADPAQLASPGESTTLRWQTSGASEVSLRQDGGEAEPIPSNGERVFQLEATSIFELSARGASGPEATKTLSVNVEGTNSAPSLGAFTAPEVVGADESGLADATLSWTGVVGASELRLEASGMEPRSLEPTSEGSIEVELRADTVFTLIARNAAGETSASTTVKVVPLPIIEDFGADRSWLGVGEAIQLSWTTDGAASVELWIDGVRFESAEPLPTTFLLEREVYLDTTFELRAFSEAMTQTSASEEVVVAPPQIASFEVSTTDAWLSEIATFDWETMGAFELSLTLAGEPEPRCAAQVPENLLRAGCEVELDVVGESEFILSVSNASGVASRSRNVSVSSGPGIEVFTASAQDLSPGDKVLLSWRATPDREGEEPTLLITSSEGQTYPLTDLEGTIEAVVQGAGMVVFTLEASTSHPLSIRAEAQVTVVVHPIPIIDLQASALHFDDLNDEPITFSWTAENAVELTLFQIEADGSPTTILEIPAGEIAAGSLPLSPFTSQGNANFLLMGKNLAGTPAEAALEIVLPPLEIVDFQVDELEIVTGEPVQLDWAVRTAESVSLDIFEGSYVREENQTAYEDIELSSPTRLALEPDCLCAHYTFPAGFDFPFEGKRWTSIYLYRTGIAGFHSMDEIQSFPGYTDPPLWGNPQNSQRLPTEVYSSYVNLAPFWGDLVWNEERTPNGALTVLYDGEKLIAQWKDLSFFNHRSVSVSFQLVLWEDGRFEYRYGLMEPGSAPPGWILGDHSTIGYQTSNGSQVDLRKFRQEIDMEGQVAQRTFVYRPAPSVGSRGSETWHPFSRTETASATLRARRGDQELERTVSVTIRQPPTFSSFDAPEEPTRTNENFRLIWTTIDAEKIEVFDESDTLRCEIQNPAVVQDGFCSLQEGLAKTFRYRVVATGARGSQREVEAEVVTYHPFGIDRFEADRTRVNVGESIELSWETTGPAELRLVQEGIDLIPPGSVPPTGSLRIPSVAIDSIYLLTMTNHLGLVEEAKVEVKTWKVSLALTPSTTTARPGDLVHIDVDAKSLQGGAAPVVFGSLPLQEQTDQASAYADIRSVLGAAELGMGNNDLGVTDFTFPTNFVFPYFGTDYHALSVGVDGFVSLSHGADVRVNGPLPNAAYPNHQLVPFWDDLILGSGAIWTAMPTPETFVIQWHQVNRKIDYLSTTRFSFSFQLVLHASGDFEFRYGAMNPPTTTDPGCYPSSCINEAAGSSATIGFQGANGTIGRTLHHGGGQDHPENKPFPGGLANRSFRYQALSGTERLSFRPTKTDTYEFCVGDGDQLLCRSVEIQAEFGIGEFETSSTLIGVGTPATLSWRTVGGQELIIREGGTVLTTIQDLDRIDEGTLEVRPTQHATYTLELRSPGREDTAAVQIEVDRLRLSAEASNTTSFPGTPITLSWELLNLMPDLEPTVVRPLIEFHAHDFADLDISAAEDTQLLFGPGVAAGVERLQFDQGFTFPFLGREMSEVHVSSEGYLSFAAAPAAALERNQPLPNTSFREVHLAPFWDDLHTRATGRILAKRVGPDTYVIQWSGVSLNFGSTNANQFDLNFMTVLHRSGDFEFRYGKMKEPPAPSTVATDCYPASCANEANAASATIGYQDLTGAVGDLLHFGGVGRSPLQAPFPAGLSDRSWRFQAGSVSGSMQVAPIDSRVYRICAQDSVTLDLFCAEPIEVEVDWGISSFTSSAESVLRGASVGLSWESRNLDSLRLLANGVELLSQSQPNIPGTFSTNHMPTGRTAYVLEGRSQGRTIRLERIADVRTFELALQPSKTVVFPGESVELSWNATLHETGPFALTLPMEEVDTAPPSIHGFVDANTLPGAAQVSPLPARAGSISLALPFDFPYFGETHRSVDLYTVGHLSFSGAPGSGSGGNLVLPMKMDTAAARSVNLAPFWDDLNFGAASQIWTAQPDPDTFIVQWTHHGRYFFLPAAYDLNFQVVLHRDGSFEYRYGDMLPPPPPFNGFGCFPATCELEANGSSATIGYQTVDTQHGQTLQYGGTTAATISEIPGGLSHRTWRLAPTTSGTISLQVDATQDVELCGFLGDYKKCETVTVRAAAHPGDLMITELMIDPNQGVAGQWFELRNLSRETIDLQGFTISSRAGAHTIASPLPIAPGGLATLAVSSSPGFQPDYVYADVSLDTQVDELELRAGSATIARAAWGSSWTIPAGQALSLKPIYHAREVNLSLVRGVVANEDFSRWCVGTSMGTPGVLDTGCDGAAYYLDPSSPAPFLDIKDVGTRLTAAEATSSVTPVPAPGFRMPFFDTVVDRVWIGSNGWVSFSPTNPGGAAAESPRANQMPRGELVAPAGPLVAVYYDLLSCENPLSPCSIHSYQGEIDGMDVLILQWNSAMRVSYPGAITFQVQLWENGDIVLAFDESWSTATLGNPMWGFYQGGGAWMGLEAPDRSHISLPVRSPREIAHRSYHFVRR